MICSHSCPCWDLKGERLHIHYCLPERLILQGTGIVSFVSYCNSLITNDSVGLNMGKRSSRALSDQHWAQGNWRCSAALGGPQSHSLPWATRPTTRASLQVLLRWLLRPLVRAERGTYPPAPLLWAALAIRMGLDFSSRCRPHIPGKSLPSIMLLGCWTWSISSNEEKVRKTLHALFSPNYLSWVQIR